MTALTKEALLALKPKMEAVPVPELGEGAEVYIREMNGLDVLEYGGVIADITGGKPVESLPVQKQKPVMQFLLERTLCDADGHRLFADGEAGKVAIPWSAMQRLWTKASEVNQMEDASAPKKSSEETPISTSRAA